MPVSCSDREKVSMSLCVSSGMKKCALIEGLEWIEWVVEVECSIVNGCPESVLQSPSKPKLTAGSEESKWTAVESV